MITLAIPLTTMATPTGASTGPLVPLKVLGALVLVIAAAMVMIFVLGALGNALAFRETGPSGRPSNGVALIAVVFIGVIVLVSLIGLLQVGVV